MGLPQPLHFPRRKSQDSTGTFSYHGISRSQAGQNERRGWFTDIPLGSRWMHTFRKDPTSAPKAAAQNGATSGMENITCSNQRAAAVASTPDWLNATVHLYNPLMRSLCILLAIGQIFVNQAFAGVDIFAELGRVAPAKKEAGDKKSADAPAGTAAGKGGSHEKFLNITVRNSLNKPEANLTVRYWYFGRDMKTMKVDVVGGGESIVNLKPNGMELISCAGVQNSYTEKSPFVGKPAGPKAGAAPAAKPQDTGGIKIAGYGVQVIKEGKVIAETFLETGHKKVVGSEGSKPGNAFTPKEAPAN